MKKRHIMLLALCVALVGASLGLVGCQAAAEKAAEKAAEGVVEGATGVDIDTDENKVTIEGEDGSTVEIQSGAELPEDYPDDAPSYDNATIESSGKFGADDQTAWTIVQKTGDDFDTVVSTLRESLADEGWTESGSTETNSDGMQVAIIAASKGDAQCSVAVQQTEGEDVEISISVNE